MASQSRKDRRETTLQRSLVVQGCEIGTVTHGHFQSYTNFSMDILHAVSSPKGAKPTLFGYVYSVKTSSGHQSDCFVSTDDNLTVRSFVRSASKSNPHLQAAKISDKLWSLYVLNMAKEYQNSRNYKQMTLVSRVGKQPNSRTWVLSPDIQIDHEGRLISQDRQKFFWHEEYIHMLIQARVVPIPITTPLSPQPMIHLLQITKRCLDNNFLSFFVTLAGAVIVLHYEDVLGIQDECPLVLCFSPSSGTGKSTTLRNVFSILGADHIHITGPDTHPAAIVSWAAGTTIPLGIDDIRSAKKAESIAVQFFNGFSHNTCKSGELKPHTSVIVTSNSTFCNSERNSQRILHIPFFPPTKPTSPPDLRRCEMDLKQARVDASASIGTMIALGDALMSQESQHYLDQTVLPLVTEYLPTVHFRVQKCYALLLTAAKLLCQVIPADVVQYQEVLEFFTRTMSPLICQLHSPGSRVLSMFLNQLISVLQPLKTHEVLQMLRPSYVHKGVPCIAMYMPMVREHCSLSTDAEKQLKDAIKAGGGVLNGSALFLSTTSTATYVCKATGTNRRSVAFIPHSEMNSDELERLNTACSETESGNQSASSKVTPLSSSISTLQLEPDTPDDPLPEMDISPSLNLSQSDPEDTESDTPDDPLPKNSSFPSLSQSHPEDTESDTPDDTLKNNISPSLSQSDSEHNEQPDTPNDPLPEIDISSNLSQTKTSKSDLDALLKEEQPESIQSVKYPASLVPEYDESSESDESYIDSPVMTSTPKSTTNCKERSPSTNQSAESDNQPDSSTMASTLLVSTDINANALIHPTAKKTTKESTKEQCPPERCIMKRPNKRTWWVQCAQCSQWYHVKCAKLTKKKAQDMEFICEECI